MACNYGGVSLDLLIKACGKMGLVFDALSEDEKSLFMGGQALRIDAWTKSQDLQEELLTLEQSNAVMVYDRTIRQSIELAEKE
jgi:hypothetical protein